MIPPEEALRICETNFPNGPEALARVLNIKLIETELQGVEGWYLRGLKTIIRINSSSPKSRQRFTLAHELAHLILGTKTDIVIEPFRSDAQEERAADSLAAEFLLPKSEVQRHLGNYRPIDGKSLSRLATAAKVSQVMAACRVIDLYESQESIRAAVIHFRNSALEWQFGNITKLPDGIALRLLNMATLSRPELVRIDQNNGTHAVAALLETNLTQILFVQILASQIALARSYDER